jgi:hypothetical protein
VDEDMEEKEPLYTVGAAIMEISMKVPEKTKTDLPYNPAIPLLHIYPKKC